MYRENNKLYGAMSRYIDIETEKTQKLQTYQCHFSPCSTRLGERRQKTIVITFSSLSVLTLVIEDKSAAVFSLNVAAYCQCACRDRTRRGGPIKTAETRTDAKGRVAGYKRGNAAERRIRQGCLTCPPGKARPVVGVPVGRHSYRFPFLINTGSSPDSPFLQYLCYVTQRNCVLFLPHAAPLSIVKNSTEKIFHDFLIVVVVRNAFRSTLD